MLFRSAVGDNDALLEVGETWSYTAAHTVTQEEIDSNGGGDGQLENTATADSNETGPDTDDASVPVAPLPSGPERVVRRLPGPSISASWPKYTLQLTAIASIRSSTCIGPFARRSCLYAIVILDIPFRPARAGFVRWPRRRSPFSAIMPM